MAVGDTVFAISDVAPDALVTIQPAGSEEWVIHLIEFENTIEIIRTNGAISVDGWQVTGGADPGPGNQPGIWHVTNTFYLQIRNKGTVNQVISYSGVIIKV